MATRRPMPAFEDVSSRLEVKHAATTVDGNPCFYCEAIGGFDLGRHEDESVHIESSMTPCLRPVLEHSLAFLSLA